MKTKLQTKRVSTITVDTENRNLSLKVTIDYSDGTSDMFVQDFNLNVMPYDMAMSVICSLINPQKPQR